jgi:hypothetical protein
MAHHDRCSLEPDVGFRGTADIVLSGGRQGIGSERPEGDMACSSLASQFVGTTRGPSFGR